MPGLHDPQDAFDDFVVPYDAQSAKALQLTFREALRLGHNYVGTEHLLLGLLADEESPAARLIGVTHAAAEEHIVEAVAAE